MTDSNQTSKSSSKPKTMAELMASQTKLVTLHKGDIIDGKITKLTSSEILVNISAKAEAVVLEKDKKIMNNILATLKVGDAVTVQVLNSESDMGHPVVSLRRFLNNRLWVLIKELQKERTAIEITVNEVIKGGHLVSTDTGISGFLPNSQVSYSQSKDENLSEGKKIKAIVLEADRTTGKLIFSQSQSVTSSDFRKSAQKLKMGDKIKGVITSVTLYGLFISVPVDGSSIDGFIHISELSWEKILDISGDYNVGDSIEASVLGLDEDARRVNLSAKKLKTDPFDEKMKGYPIDKKVTGKVREVRPIGVTVDLGDGMEALIKKEKIPPTMSFKIGDTVEAVVSDVDAKRRRIMLTPVLKEKPLTYR